MGNVALSLATVPESQCYSNPQTDWPVLVSLMDASLAGTLNNFNYGNSVPAAADRTKPWYRLNSDGSPDGWYAYSSGYWLKPHTEAVGSVKMWEGDLSDLPTFDGGEAGSVTLIGGPFWEEVTEMAARSPIHPGTLPSTTILTINNNYGEEKHVQTESELVSHTHQFATEDSQQVLVKVGSNKVGDINQTGSLDYAFADAPQNTGGGQGFNVIHPVRTIWFIRRTARLYYRI